MVIPYIDEIELSPNIWEQYIPLAVIGCDIVVLYIEAVYDLNSYTYSDALAAVLKFSGRQIVIF